MAMNNNSESSEQMKFDPITESVIKSISKLRSQQAQEAAMSGVPADQIIQKQMQESSTLGKLFGMVGGSSSKGLYQKGSINMETGEITPSSALFGLLKESPQRLQEKQQALKTQLELRKLVREERNAPVVAEMDIVNKTFDLAKKMRESSVDFQQREDIRGLRNSVYKQELLQGEELARNSFAAIDAFESLKSSFYQGFEPVDIATVTGKPLAEAGINDLLFAKGQGAGKALMAKLGKSPQGSAFLRNVEGFATLISRGGLQEKGTLTDTDRKVVVKMFNLALSNKEEADTAFNIIQNILSKPTLRSAASRIKRLGETIEDVDLPLGMKDRALAAKSAGFGDLEIIESLMSNIDDQSRGIK